MSEMDPRAEDWAEGDDAEDEWTPDDQSLEAPEADALDQHTPVGAHLHGHAGETPPDVNEADVAEQSIDVDLDDDDYR